MAILTVRDAQGCAAQVLDADDAIRAYLAPHGVDFERWPVPDAIAALAAQVSLDDAGKAAILDGFRPKLAELARTKGYAEADVVVLHPGTPGLDDALARFDKVHLHTDDEIRYIVDGRGIFGFAPEEGPAFEIEVHASEYIRVPANAWHWFTLCEDRRIKAIRIFKDTAGWVPHYRDAA